MPPTQWEAVNLLFITYMLIVEMLFTKNNAHPQSINSVRRQLMMTANIRHCFDASYYATIVWACMYDGVQHFNKHMPYSDLQGGGRNALLQSPTTQLHEVAHTMQQHTTLDNVTFP